MVVYVVRNKESKGFLGEPGSAASGVAFKYAYLFESLDDARREVARYPSWREVVAVRWEVDISIQKNAGGRIINRPRLVRMMKAVKP